MVRSGEKLLNDLIIFLTICPNGLDLAEIKILLNQFQTRLTPEEKRKKIELYLDLLTEASTIGDGEATTSLERSPNSVVSESEEKLENLREIIKHLLFFDIV